MRICFQTDPRSVSYTHLLTEVLRPQQANDQIGPLFEKAKAAYAELTMGIEALLGKNE